MISLKAKSMDEVNYKNDFIVDCIRTDHRGKELSPPNYDWEMNIWTDDEKKAVKVTYKDGEFYNCYYENGHMMVIVNDHHLNPGQLHLEYIEYVPCEEASDKLLTQVIPVEVDIVLVDGPSYYGESLNATLVLPHLKGDQGEPFLYEDFTPEQIENLKRPAKEAADALDEKVRTVFQAEQERIKAEKLRETADQNRDIEIGKFRQELSHKADTEDLSPVLWEDTDAEADDILPGVVQSAVRFTEQALTPEERAQALKNLGEPEMMLFIRMWNAAVGDYGCYNEETGYFELNGITDITYSEALAVMSASVISTKTAQQGQFFVHDKTVRTVMPIDVLGAVSIGQAFRGCTKLESISVHSSMSHFFNDLAYTFSNCVALKEILGTFSVSGYLGGPGATRFDMAFHNCESLKRLNLDGLKANVSFQWSPRLSLESLQYMVGNARNTSAITITLHPLAFARLTDDLIAAAQAKNISFVTP